MKTAVELLRSWGIVEVLRALVGLSPPPQDFSPGMFKDRGEVPPSNPPPTHTHGHSHSSTFACPNALAECWVPLCVSPGSLGVIGEGRGGG